MKFYKIVVFVICCMPLSVLGQENLPSAESLFAKAKAFYENENQYQIATHYTMYRGFSNEFITDQQDGVVLKNNNIYYSRIQNTEYVITPKEYVKINHDQKAIEYVKTTTPFPVNNALNINEYLNYFSDKKVSKEGDYYKCVLTTPRLTQLPYGKVIIYFNINDFSLVKQDLLLIGYIEYKNDKGEEKKDYQRLVIEFDSFLKKITLPENVYKVNTYVAHLSDNMITASQKYKNYRFFNRTIK